MRAWSGQWRRFGLIALAVILVPSCLLTSSFDGLTGAEPSPDGGDDPSTSSAGGAGSNTVSAGGRETAVSSTSSGSSSGGIGGAFPSTPLLDNFDRMSGFPGSLWLLESINTYFINDGQLTCAVGDCDVILWGERYGADQEAWATISAFNTDDDELELILKSQGLVEECNSLQLDYQPPALGLHSCVTNAGNDVFKDVGTSIDLELKPGDQLGARAYANGIVEAYHNGRLVKTWDASAWPFYKNGGRIGWASYGIVTPVTLDNFGGGGSDND